MIPISIRGNEVDLISITPLPILGVTFAALLYIRACSILAGRGRIVPVWQRASYFSGLGLILLATQTAIDTIGEQYLLSVHMAQHMLLADIPAPLLLLGVRSPVLYFFWPKTILKTAARMPLLRRFWGQLRRPPIALGIWLVVLYAWHIPAVYHLALENRLVHDLEHLSFALTGVLAWWPVLDPTHKRVESRVWKAGYIFAARTVGGMIGVILLVWPWQIYTAYGAAAYQMGLSPLNDQRAAGAVMMAVDFVIVIVGVLYFVMTTGWVDEQGGKGGLIIPPSTEETPRDGAAPGETSSPVTTAGPSR